ncbi:MAG TPA: hypothetical protein VEK79_19420 [Thermoanaerobaculia bacterium]|nr:hypothetical protein [Thermoanaerobaculia bacterium]
MRILDIIFWAFFAGTVGFIAWSFLRLFVDALADRRAVKHPPHNASAAGGGGESAPSDYGTSTVSSVETETGDTGESAGGGDFSGGGGESGGGGSSGGWS